MVPADSHRVGGDLIERVKHTLHYLASFARSERAYVDTL